MFTRRSGEVTIRLAKGARKQWSVAVRTPYEGTRVRVAEDDISEHLRGTEKLDAISRVALKRAERKIRVEKYAEMRGSSFVVSGVNRTVSDRSLMAKIKRALNELE